MNEIKGGDASIELSSDLNIITAEINAYQRVAGEAIFEIGRRLKHVKENDLAHGEWSKWCESIGMSRGQATKFITVFDELSTANDSTWNQIGLQSLYLIATLPPDQRDQPHTVPSTGATKTVDEMTVRELREVKKALKEAEEARKQAEAQRDMAQKESDILRDTLESREDVEPALRTEYIKDDRAEVELGQYKELFGDISMYEGKATRVTNADAITYSVFEFEEDVRRFVEKYGHLTHFPREFSAMISEGKSEYKNSIQTLFSLLKQLDRNLDEAETIIIEN